MAAQSFPIPPSTSGNTPRWTQPVSFYGQSVFSKYYAHSICAFLLLVPFLISPASAQGQGAIGGQNCVTNYDANANVDYFPSKISVDNAALFKVRYEKNFKVVTNTAAGTNKESVYVLYQCGTPAPAATGFANGTVFVEVPAKAVASLTTTSVAYIEMLGRRSAIKVVDTEGLVSSPCVQLGLEKGEIVGLEDNNKTLRAEQFKGADLVFSGFTVENGTESKSVTTSEVSDPGPLNRAEWLEFYSTFFNLEESAQKLTGSINNNYNCFKTAANAKPTKPVVAWSTYTAPSSFNENVASWSLSGADYKRILTVDAGATFYNGTTTSKFTNSADFLAAMKTVDIVIDETFAGSDMTAFLQSYQLTSASTADYKFLQNKAVFRQDGLVNPNDGRDWFGAGVAMADAILQDVIRAVHPEALPQDVPYNWLRNIAKDEKKQLLNSANCTATDGSTPVPDRAITCSTMKTGAANKVAGSALAAFLGLLAAALVL
ncbi:hypothetical protein BGX24_000399 [Mortierella sp. AD032]|nr:hypothetical protein BGX24_000399 [Mortierella sp. AD032]